MFPMAMWWVMYCPIPNYNSVFLSNVFGFFGADENNIHGALPDIEVESNKALEVVLDRISH